MKKKVLGLLIFFLVIGVFYLFDFTLSKLYTIELVEVNPLPIPADGSTLVSISARLTRGGKAVQGHDLYILSLDGGMFTAYRLTTGSDGMVQYFYYPYRASTLNPLRDIRFQITDESNSVFLEVSARGDFVVPTIAGETENRRTNLYLFGE